jgi:hypothetical protein
MVFDPALDFATKLAATNGSLTLGTNLFAGPMHAPDGTYMPELAVFCTVEGGEIPVDYCDGSATPKLYTPMIKVVLRTNPGVYSDTLARAIITDMMSNPPTDYIGCQAFQSVPDYIGGSDKDGHYFTMRFRLIYEE